jgi:hypothetical protein
MLYCEELAGGMAMYSRPSLFPLINTYMPLLVYISQLHKRDCFRCGNHAE